MRKLALLLGALAASGPAFAHGRVAIGIGFGFPIWAPAPVYYYPAPVVISNPQPIRYIERRETAPTSLDFWYYCEQSKAYYPYVKTCPAGWQKVSPTPPG
jgi:hypothetical protein